MQDNDAVSYAVTVERQDGQWSVRSFSDDFTNPSVAITAVRNLRAESAAFALLCVDNEYFVIVRPGPKRNGFFLSDATMAVDDDFAAAILDEVGLEVPDIDPADLDNIDGYADGDFDILSDLGVTEELLTVLSENPDTWPADALAEIADDLGFADELEVATS